MPDVAETERKAKWSVTVNGKKYDTLVCEAVRKNPLAFVDILKGQAEAAEKDECVSRDFVPLLYEAASVIANLLLTNNLRQFSC